MLPCHRICCTQGRFMYVPVRGLRGITADINGFCQKSVSRSEDRSHIMHAPDIVQKKYDWQFLRGPNFSCSLSWKFVHPKFSHGVKLSLKAFHYLRFNGFRLRTYLIILILFIFTPFVQTISSNAKKTASDGFFKLFTTC